MSRDETQMPGRDKVRVVVTKTPDGHVKVAQTFKDDRQVSQTYDFSSQADFDRHMADLNWAYVVELVQEPETAPE